MLLLDYTNTRHANKDKRKYTSIRLLIFIPLQNTQLCIWFHSDVVWHSWSAAWLHHSFLWKCNPVGNPLLLSKCICDRISSIFAVTLTESSYFFLYPNSIIPWHVFCYSPSLFIGNNCIYIFIQVENIHTLVVFVALANTKKK